MMCAKDMAGLWDMTERDARMETVAMLIQPGQNPEIVVNAVKAVFPRLVVIEEEPESKKLFIRRRKKARLGAGARTGRDHGRLEIRQVLHPGAREANP